MSGVRLSRHYLSRMKAANWGRILFIASESAVNIPKEMIHYGVSKTMQVALARGLAETTAGTGVTVNSILAGPTRSEGVEGFVANVAKAQNTTPAAVEKSFFEGLPASFLLQRFATTDEVAAMVVFMASSLSVRDRRRGASRRRWGRPLHFVNSPGLPFLPQERTHEERRHQENSSDHPGPPKRRDLNRRRLLQGTGAGRARKETERRCARPKDCGRRPQKGHASNPCLDYRRKGRAWREAERANFPGHQGRGRHCARHLGREKPVEGLEAQPGDFVVEKTRMCAFTNTNLEQILKGCGVERIVIIGAWTNFSIEHTAPTGADLGYECSVISDATSTINDEWQRAALNYALTNIAEIATTQEALDAIG